MPTSPPDEDAVPTDGAPERDKWLETYRESRQATAMEPHDVELIDVDADQIILEMSIGDHARQPYGLLHGGVSLLLAESAASMHACWGVDLDEKLPVGIEVNCSHIDSAREGTVRAVGRVIKRGRTLIRHRVEIIHRESGRLLSDIRVTNLYKSVEG
ncbi:MAG: PaaI family thioesterase [Persicimonas sp.]